MASEPQNPASSTARTALRHAWRVVILVIGSTLVLIGVALLVLPGPGLLGIAFGLAVLATEFAWARRLLHQVRARIDSAAGALRGSRDPGGSRNSDDLR